MMETGALQGIASPGTSAAVAKDADGRPIALPATNGLIVDPRVFKALGFNQAVHCLWLDDSAVVWSGKDSIFASGAPARHFASLATSVSGRRAAPPPVAGPPGAAANPILRATIARDAALPSDTSTPLDWLRSAQSLPEENVKTWVLTVGLTGPHPKLWASFALAMGWTIPSVTEASPESLGSDTLHSSLPTTEGVTTP